MTADIIIAGGGLVGLASALFLAQQGAAPLVVERRQRGSALPRAAHFHLRTLELFRAAGIEDEVKAQSLAEFLPDGAIIERESLAGPKRADIIASLNEGVEALSPCRRLFINQSSLEPILRRHAEAHGVEFLDGHEIGAVQQDASGVSVSARDVLSGAERHLDAAYLVAADGGHSIVRERLGIPWEGRGAFSNSITIYFAADLSSYLGVHPASVTYINNDRLGGIFRLARDGRSGFLIVNTIGDPTRDRNADVARDVSETRLIELVRSGVGVADLPVRIESVSRWRATAQIARHFREGRIFLVGDAAHVMPPNGGFGGNTGIHDAHNLAWKLASVLKGIAGPRLLDTYEAERRPVAKFTAEQAYTRYVRRTAPYLSDSDLPPLAPDFDIELGYIYRSAGILSEAGHTVIHGDPHQAAGRPGTRAPHLWLERDGERLSSLDLYGNAPVLLAGPRGAPWCQAAATFPLLTFHRIGIDLTDPDDRFTEVLGLSPSGAALIRPDGFIAWRSRQLVGDLQGELRHALDALFVRITDTCPPSSD